MTKWDKASADEVLADIERAKRTMFGDRRIEVLPEGNEFGMIKGADSIAIVSGGLDSVTLVYHMMSMGYTPHMLSFDYGQRHKKELQYARATAKQLNLHHDIVDLTGLTHLISNSALTSNYEFDTEKCSGTCDDSMPHSHHLTKIHEPIEVPEGHYAEDTMKATVVPNRNMIMLSIAAGVAVSKCYKTIGIGVHGGDHFIYPDCRPTFINAARDTINTGNEGFHSFQMSASHNWKVTDPIYSPFIHKTKADIAYMALELGVPLHMTWSCYKGGENHCGRCGTCVERLEAIDEAMGRFKPESTWKDFQDQTVYDDNEFWRTAVKNAGKVS